MQSFTLFPKFNQHLVLLSGGHLVKICNLSMQRVHSAGHRSFSFACLVQPLGAILQRVLKHVELITHFEIVHHPLRLNGGELVPYLIEDSRALTLINESLLQQVHSFIKRLKERGEVSKPLLALVVLFKHRVQEVPYLLSQVIVQFKEG